MAKQKKPHTAETREEWEARVALEQKERDENRNLLVAFAGLNSPTVNEALQLEEYGREANEIEARVEARKQRDEAEQERKKQEQWEKDRQEREAQGFYDYRQESRGLPTAGEAVKGAKEAKFGADARATAPWDALTRMHEVAAGGALGGQIPLKTDPYSLDHVLGSDKFAGIGLDSIYSYLSDDGKKAVDSLKGSGIGQYGKDKDDKEFSKDSLGLFDLFYTAATDPGDILRPLDNVYDQLQTLGGMVTAANGLKPFLTKDGQKVVDALTVLDFGRTDPTGTAQLIRDLLHGDASDPNRSLTPFQDFFDSAMSKEGVTAILNATKPFLGKDGQKVIEALQKAGFATDKDAIGLFPALQELDKGNKATVDILSDLLSNLATEKGLAALLQGLTPFLPKEGAIAAQAMAEMLKGEWKEALGTLTKLLPKDAQAPAKALLALLKNDFQGFLMALANEYLPKELQQTLGIFMQMGGFKGVFGLELPKPHDLVGLGEEGKLGAGDAVVVSGCQGGPLAARVKDPVTSSLGPGFLTVPASPSVMIGKEIAARELDPAVCSLGPDTVLKGEPTVLICGKPAARAGDPMAAGGTILKGFPTVMIGSAPAGPSSTAETSSGADAAASSASTAGSAGGASAGGEGTTEGQAGKEGAGAGATDGSGKKQSDEYDLSKDGSDKLRYPTEGDPPASTDEGEFGYNLAGGGRDQLILPAEDKKSDPLETVGKLVGARGQTFEKGAEAYESEAKANIEKAAENEAKAKGDYDAAKSAREAAQSDVDSQKQKVAEISARQDQAQRDFGTNYSQRDPEAKQNLQEIEKLEAEKPSAASIARSEGALQAANANEGKSAAKWLESGKDLKSANQSLKNVEDLKAIGKYTAGLGYAFATKDALTASGSDGLSTTERLGAYWAAEAIPDLATGAVVAGMAVISAPVAVTGAVVLSVGWGAYEIASGGKGETFLRDTITGGVKYVKTDFTKDFKAGSKVVGDYSADVVADAYDYWSSGW